MSRRNLIHPSMTDAEVYVLRQKLIKTPDNPATICTAYDFWHPAIYRSQVMDMVVSSFDLDPHCTTCDSRLHIENGAIPDWYITVSSAFWPDLEVTTHLGGMIVCRDCTHNYDEETLLAACKRFAFPEENGGALQ